MASPYARNAMIETPAPTGTIHAVFSFMKGEGESTPSQRVAIHRAPHFGHRSVGVVEAGRWTGIVTDE